MAFLATENENRQLEDLLQAGKEGKDFRFCYLQRVKKKKKGKQTKIDWLELDVGQRIWVVD